MSAASTALAPSEPAWTAGLEAGQSSLAEQVQATVDPALAQRLAIQQSQLEATRALLPLLQGLDALAPGDRVDRSLEVADAALAHRIDLVQLHGPSAALDGLFEQAANLEAARGLVDAHRVGDGGLEEALAHVAAVSARQAQALGVEVDAQPPALPALDGPVQAVEVIAVRQDVPVPDPARSGLAALDDLPAPVRSALTDTLAAYLAFDAAVLDLDPSDALAARAQLLDQAHRLDLVLQATGGLAPAAVEPVRVPGAVAIDLAGGATTYTEDYAFLLDAGGDDVYLNNAGGSNLGGGGCALEESAGAAAAIDLAGDDAYGQPDTRRGCGATGGAYTGAGLLLDVGGEDRFHAGSTATNGGAVAEGLGLLVAVGGDDLFDAHSFGTNGGGVEAAGALVSVGGQDTYEGGSLGSNGAATASGVGILVDTEGSEVYHGGIIGANGAGDGYLLGTGVGVLVDLGDGDDAYLSSGGNGGGSRKGVGFLYDGGGTDRFVSHAFGTNGGGQASGVGMLVSAGGPDTFLSDYTGANGGASSQGVGFLVNLGTGSTYGIHDEDSAVRPGGQGFNGGSALGGVAFLLDGGGGHFQATSGGANGGTNGDGVSLLITGEGQATFEARGAGVNGGAKGGTALLVNLGGDDRYQAEDGGTNGGGDDEGVAGLLDLGGEDTYLGDGRGSNGGADDGGHGLLVDAGGDDLYRAGSGGANGHANALSYGLLLDLGGHDYYEDGEGGTGWDKTVVPKGAVGAQVDQEGPT